MIRNGRARVFEGCVSRLADILGILLSVAYTKFLHIFQSSNLDMRKSVRLIWVALLSLHWR